MSSGRGAGERLLGCANDWRRIIVSDMATTNLRAGELETDAPLQHRIARETELIAQARASAAVGYMVSEEEADAWIDSFDGDQASHFKANCCI